MDKILTMSRYEFGEGMYIYQFDHRGLLVSFVADETISGFIEEKTIIALFHGPFGLMEDEGLIETRTRHDGTYNYININACIRREYSYDGNNIVGEYYVEQAIVKIVNNTTAEWSKL